GGDIGEPAESGARPLPGEIDRADLTTIDRADEPGVEARRQPRDEPAVARRRFHADAELGGPEARGDPRADQVAEREFVGDGRASERCPGKEGQGRGDRRPDAKPAPPASVASDHPSRLTEARVQAGPDEREEPRV